MGQSQGCRCVSEVILCGCEVHAYSNDSGGRQLRWLHSTTEATFYNLVSEPDRGTKSPDEGTWKREDVTSFEGQEF